jgi:signal transduction histidine kinase
LTPLPLDPRLVWDPTAMPPARRLRALVAFVLLYAALVYVGRALRTGEDTITIIWPASGLLINALYFSPRRAWLTIVPLQIAAELAFDIVGRTPGGFHWHLAFACADSLEALFAAGVLRAFVSTPQFARVAQVLKYFLAAAAGAALSATLGAFGAVHGLGQESYLQQWQVWWAGNFLGSAVIAPVVLCWTVKRQLPQFTASLRSRGELAVLGGLLVLLVAWIFSTQRADVRSLLQLPLAVLALLVVAAFRLPPRWSTTLAATVTLLCAWLASLGYGPFSVDAAHVRAIGELQLFLGSLALFTFLLATVLLEQSATLQRLRTSDERYRNFVEQSSEAVWRVELATPMPIDLPPAAQAEWLRRESHVAECNRRYRWLAERGESVDAASGLHRELPWPDLFAEHLEKAARQGYRMEDLRVDFRIEGRTVCYTTSFAGVVENGRLLRLWGVARDVTELVELNRRLAREQDRLRAYAQQLIGAEERARRSTAVELHDGMGQMLEGLGRDLEGIGPELPGTLGPRVQAMAATVRQIRESTQRVIADLSPPGLYELGLGPALQWLAIQLRSKDGLTVVLDLDVREAQLSLDLRILAYRLVRELLRNVVKYARVTTAQVCARQTHDALELDVLDRGVGFEWQYDLFQVPNHGFGLWSVADRVRAVQGQIQVDTAPGRGCHIQIRLPLGGEAGGRYTALRTPTRA